MARPNNVVKFHDEEASQAKKAGALKVWQRLLRTQREVAVVQIGSTLQRLDAARLYHRFELAKFKAQMLNGVCCPDDFSYNASGASRQVL